MVEDIILTMMLAPTTDVRGEGDSTMKTEWRRIDSDLQGGGSEQNQNMREMRRGRRYGAAERGDVRGPSAEGGDADGDAGMVWRRRGRRSMGTGWRRSDDDLRGKRAVSDGDLRGGGG
jgi:hypothetical protein|uniref:Uncharacterized protein n=3 Tax=Oryza TaxID=4527 RepID=A0A0D3F4H8_9ORYZ